MCRNICKIRSNRRFWIPCNEGHEDLFLNISREENELAHCDILLFHMLQLYITWFVAASDIAFICAEHCPFQSKTVRLFCQCLYVISVAVTCLLWYTTFGGFTWPFYQNVRKFVDSNRKIRSRNSKVKKVNNDLQNTT